MRERALKFVKEAIANQRKAVALFEKQQLKQDERPYATPDNHVALLAERHAKSVDTLAIWEAMLTMMQESEVPTKFPINTSKNGELCPHELYWDSCPDCCH